MWGCSRRATRRRLVLEVANEGRVVGELRTDHFHRHLATDRWLIGPYTMPSADTDPLPDLVATDRIAELSARIEGVHVELQLWELGGRAGNNELEHLLGSSEAFQPMFAEAPDLYARLTVQLTLGCRGQQDLSPVSDAHQPRAPVHRCAEEVATSHIDLSDVD